MGRNCFEMAICFFKTQGNLGRMLGISQQRVQYYRANPEALPYWMAIDIYLAMDGKISLDGLAPRHKKKNRIFVAGFLAEHNQSVPELYLSCINVPEKPIDEARVAWLMADIQLNGLVQPIGVDGSGVLVFGYHRYMAYQRLGKESIPYCTVDADAWLSDVSAAIMVTQTLCVSDRIAVGICIEAELKANKMKKVDLDPPFRGKKRDFIAQLLGFKSSYPYRLAQIIVKSCEYPLIDLIDANQLPIKTAYRQLQATARRTDVPYSRPPSLD